jgi:deoxycytidine triphosphate deaminase
MSQKASDDVGRRSEYFHELVMPERKSQKTFKKQWIQKASSEEKKMFSIFSSSTSTSFLRNQTLTSTEIVWFDPIIDPRKNAMKHPVRNEGGVSFLLFAVTPDNENVELTPMRCLTIGTGFCLHTGLYESKSSLGDYPNWYASIFGLQSHMKEGIFVGSILVDPHDHSELKISMFNMGSKGFLIRPTDPIGQIVFNGCHVPNIASVTDLSERFEGESLLEEMKIFCSVTK